MFRPPKLPSQSKWRSVTHRRRADRISCVFRIGTAGFALFPESFLSHASNPPHRDDTSRASLRYAMDPRFAGGLGRIADLAAQSLPEHIFPHPARVSSQPSDARARKMWSSPAIPTDEMQRPAVAGAENIRPNANIPYFISINTRSFLKVQPASFLPISALMVCRARSASLSGNTPAESADEIHARGYLSRRLIDSAGPGRELVPSGHLRTYRWRTPFAGFQHSCGTRSLPDR